MPQHRRKAVVAGHVCLDLIPSFGGTAAPEAAGQEAGRWADMLQPGRLVQVGPALFAAGGSVPNTGIALHKLGVPVSLVGKVGDDAFGRAVLRIVGAAGPRLAEAMVVAPGEHTSYTVILSPPGVDRILTGKGSACSKPPKT